MTNYDDLPWIIFELRSQLYAINTKLVTGIMQMPPITFVPEAPDEFLGVANIRGAVVPILSLRKLLGMSGAAEENKDLSDMLKQKKEEHLYLVNSLIDSVHSGSDFTLPTDPHKCAFGKWYYSFIGSLDESLHTLSSELKRIEEPHTKLHQTIAEIKTMKTDDGYREGTERLLERADGYAKKVAAGIDNVIEHLTDSVDKMIITLGDTPESKTSLLGFAVDGIRGVDSLEQLDAAGENRCLYMAKHIKGVAHNDKNKGEILIIDEYRVTEMAKVFDETVNKDKDKKDNANADEK